jgi:hypothetical protein
LTTSEPPEGNSTFWHTPIDLLDLEAREQRDVVGVALELLRFRA